MLVFLLKYKVGRSIHPSLANDKQYCACYSLHLCLEWKSSSLEENINLNIISNADKTPDALLCNDNLKISKKACRGIKNILISEFKKLIYAK